MFTTISRLILTWALLAAMPGLAQFNGALFIRPQKTIVGDNTSGRNYSDGSYGLTCKDYITSAFYYGSTGNGIYWIKPGSTPFKVQCDMSTDGGGWTRIYRIDVLGGSYAPTTNPYSESQSANFTSSYTRVAYKITLNSEYVWTSMNDFAAGDLSKIGLPNTYVYAGTAASLNVISNSGNVTPLTGGTAKLEFWNNCYTTGLNSVYDHADDPVSVDCYGSWQVHDNVNLKTIWAWNRWAAGRAGEGGIGNWAGTHPDWTYADNAASYSTRIMEVYVR